MEFKHKSVMLEECLKNHPELRYNYKRYTQLTTKDPENYTDEAYYNTKELTYGINLGALQGGEIDVNTEYSLPIKNEQGELVSASANSIVICVFNYLPYQPDLQFESLGFVNFMIKRYSNFLNQNAVGVIA